MLAGSIHFVPPPENRMQNIDQSKFVRSAGGFAIGEGILLLIGGILLVITNKEHLVDFLSEFTGALLVIAGIIGIVRTAYTAEHRSSWIGPLIAILSGTILLLDGQIAASALMSVLGVMLLMVGLIQISAGFGSRTSGNDRWGLLLMAGMLSSIMGIIILMKPMLAMYVFTIFFGLWLTILGIVMIRSGVEIRRLIPRSH